MRNYIIRVNKDVYHHCLLPETPYPGTVVLEIHPSLPKVLVLNVAYRAGSENIWLDCELI